MRNFFYKVSSAVARSMYGRNGSDHLNLALLLVYTAVSLLMLFTRTAALSAVLSVLSAALAVLIFFRMFSRNLAKRRAENAKFLSWWYPLRNRIAGHRQRRLDKDHKYFTCKNCKAVCRVPAGKGRIEITCPRCGQKIEGRS